MEEYVTVHITNEANYVNRTIIHKIGKKHDYMLSISDKCHENNRMKLSSRMSHEQWSSDFWHIIIVRPMTFCTTHINGIMIM